MFVVIIKEKDGALNVVGPFWHEEAARIFLRELPSESAAFYCPVTDRDKFAHA